MTAYADFLRFNELPFAGGTFAQPAWLLEEMRTVHGVYSREREKIENRQQRRGGSRRKR